MLKEKDKKLILAVCAILFILSLILIFLKFYNLVLVEKEINSSIIIRDRAGFDLTKGVMNFGMVLPGSSASRNLILENSYNSRVRIEIIPGGDMKFFLKKQVFSLAGNENKTIGLSAIVPEDMAFGNYTGSILIRIKKDI